jgi:predicted RNase H-like nuclease (RuvC/YqgF family)
MNKSRSSSGYSQEFEIGVGTETCWTAYRLDGRQAHLQDLDRRVATLQSVKGQLLREIREQQEKQYDYESKIRVLASSAEACQQREQGESNDRLVDLETVVSWESPVRADLFREMVHLGQVQGRRSYSGRMYRVFHTTVSITEQHSPTQKP